MRTRSRHSAPFRSRPKTDAGTVYSRAAELAVVLLDEALPEPTFRPQEGEATYAAKIGSPPTASLRPLAPGGKPEPDPALSPHIGARGELHGRRVTIWKARLEQGEPRAGRGAA